MGEEDQGTAGSSLPPVLCGCQCRQVSGHCHIWALSVTRWATLGSSPHPSMPQFPHLEWWPQGCGEGPVCSSAEMATLTVGEPELPIFSSVGALALSWLSEVPTGEKAWTWLAEVMRGLCVGLEHSSVSIELQKTTVDKCVLWEGSPKTTTQGNAGPFLGDSGMRGLDGSVGHLRRATSQCHGQGREAALAGVDRAPGCSGWGTRGTSWRRLLQHAELQHCVVNWRTGWEQVWATALKCRPHREAEQGPHCHLCSGESRAPPLSLSALCGCCLKSSNCCSGSRR